MLTQTIKIDLTKDIITEHIIFKQGEVGREIKFEVYNDGVAVDLDNYNVTFALYKPDGNFIIVSGTVDNDTVTVEETEQMTAVCGIGCFDLMLAKTNEVLYTFKGFVDIATPIMTRETVNSVSMVFGLIFPDDFQEKLTAGENITIVDNVISASGGGGASYTAGEYISILNNVIDVKESLISTINGKANQSDLNALSAVVSGKANQSDLNALSNVVSGKQDALTAGKNITIENNVISASGGGDVEYKHFTFYSEDYTDTTLDITKFSNNLCLVKLETTFTSHNAGTGFKYITLNVSDNERPYLPPANSYITFPCSRSSEAYTAILRTESDQNLYLRVYTISGNDVNKQSGQTYTLYGVYMARGDV